MRDGADSEIAEDEALVARIQRGETGLFAILFRRHYARMERFFWHLGVRDDDLYDLLAELFGRAFSRIAGFEVESGSRYVSYLYAIARNLATDRARERGRRPELVPLDEAWDEPDHSTPGPVQTVLWREDVAEIRRALERLSPSDREIILLSYDRELSCREIQQIMHKPSVSAVTTHLSKAMKRLRQAVLEHPARAARS